MPMSCSQEARFVMDLADAQLRVARIRETGPELLQFVRDHGVLEEGGHEDHMMLGVVPNIRGVDFLFASIEENLR